VEKRDTEKIILQGSKTFQKEKKYKNKKRNAVAKKALKKEASEKSPASAKKSPKKLFVNKTHQKGKLTVPL
jgi:hypothetical protein